MSLFNTMGSANKVPFTFIGLKWRHISHNDTAKLKSLTICLNGSCENQEKKNWWTDPLGLFCCRQLEKKLLSGSVWLSSHHSWENTMCHSGIAKTAAPSFGINMLLHYTVIQCTLTGSNQNLPMETLRYCNCILYLKKHIDKWQIRIMSYGQQRQQYCI